MTKPTLVFATVGFNIAETTRMIEIAKASCHHFEPHFASYGGKFESLIEEAGFPLHHLQPEETPEKIDYLWRVDRGETFGHPYTVEEVRQRVKSECDLIAQLQPQALVMGSVLTLAISARVAGVPLVNVVPLAMTRPYLEAGLPLTPDLPQFPFANRIINWLVLNVPLYTQHFSRVARAYNLPRFSSFISIWEGDFNLVAEISSLSGIEQLPDNWQFVGPIFAHLPGDIPANVQALADDKSKPLIYFAMGSSGNAAIVKLVTESFAGLPVNVVAPIQTHIEGTDTHVPDNVLVTDWLPAPKVNPLADIAVIHGGQGTVQTACASGTPFVGIGMQPEQSLNIETVVRYGSALRINRNKVTPARVREAITRLLADKAAKRKAIELRDEYARHNGAKRAAEFLVKTFGDPQLPPVIPLTPYTSKIRQSL